MNMIRVIMLFSLGGVVHGMEFNDNQMGQINLKEIKAPRESEVLDLTKLNGELSPFWTKLTETKELVLVDIGFYNNYSILVKDKEARSEKGKLGAYFASPEKDGEPLTLSDTSSDTTEAALALYAMVSWMQSKDEKNVKIEKIKTETYLEALDRVSKTLQSLKLEAGKTVNEWHETLAAWSSPN